MANRWGWLLTVGLLGLTVSASALEPRIAGGVLDGTEAKLNGGSFYDDHEFEGKAGESIAITLTSSDFNADFVLISPEYNWLVQPSNNEGKTARLMLTLPRSGLYRILATSSQPGAKGAYQLRWQSVTLEEVARFRQKTEATLLLQQGFQEYQAGQFQAALRLGESALQIYRSVSDQQGQAASLNNLGNAYASLKQYKQAIKFYEQSLAIMKEISDQKGESSVLGNLGDVYASLKQYQQAINYHEKSLTIKRAINNREGEAISLGNLGFVYTSLEKYQQSIDYHEKSLVIFREIGDRRGEAIALGGLGLSYFSLGEYQRALHSHEQSLNIAYEINDKKNKTNALNNLGLVYFSLGQYQGSINLYKQSLAIKHEIGDQAGKAYLLNNLGNAYLFLRKYQWAIDFHKQALAIKYESGDQEGIISSLGNLGIVYHALGQHQRAIGFYKESLRISREIDSKQEEANSLTNLGNAYYSLGQYHQVIEFSQQALALAQSVQIRDTEKTILGNLGKTFKEQGQTEAAIAFYKQSVNVTESIRQDIRGLDRTLQQSYIDGVTNTYRNLANLLLTEGRLLEAQEVLDLLTLQEIREYNRGTRATVNAQGKIEYTDRESQIIQEHGSLIEFDRKVLDCENNNCADKARLVQQRNALNQEFLQTIKKAQLDSQARQRNDESTENPTLLARKAAPIVQQQPGTILIQTFVQRAKETDNKKGKLWLLWAAGGTAGKIDREIDAVDFANTVREFREALSRPDSNPATIRQLGRKLYGWLIEPLERELTQNQIQHLIFRLDRELRYIPIAALHDGKQFLIERYTVANILTITNTNTTDRRSHTPEGDRILALGKTEGYEDFDPLPNVKDEIAAIVRNPNQGNGGLYPGDGYLDQQFTRQALETNLYGRRLLHIATHGSFSPNRATESYLLLGNNSKLYISDIQSLSNLGGLHLAVLSACQTALSGDPAGNNPGAADGSEINSLTYYFTAEGGAKAILSSLWNVNDRSTSLLMREFYRRLADDPKLTKAGALRQAQVAFLKGELTRSGDVNNPAHPFYWSPFVLTGNSW